MNNSISIYEWMSLTYVSSMEACGIDLSHIDKSWKLPMEKDFVLKWAHSTKPRIFCNDGFSFSAQGGYTAYSSPRVPSEIYDSMEIGFPSEEEPLLENYDGQVAGYVDVNTIQEIINKHGGIDIRKSFENCNLKKVQIFLRDKKLVRILNEK